MISNEYQLNRTSYILADNAGDRKSRTEALNTMNNDMTKKEDVLDIKNVGSI